MRRLLLYGSLYGALRAARAFTSCGRDFYFDDVDTHQCRRCTRGMMCTRFMNHTTQSVGIKTSFWRSSRRSQLTYKCQRTQACRGLAEDSQLSSHDPYCASLTTGTLCHACRFFRAFENASYLCHRCPQSWVTGLELLLLSGLVIALLSVLLMYARLGGRISSRRGLCASSRCKVLAQDALPPLLPKRGYHSVARFKIIWSTYQLLALFDQTLHLAYPDFATTTMRRLLAIFALKSPYVSATGCWIRADILNRMLFVTLSPIALIAGLATSAALLPAPVDEPPTPRWAALSDTSHERRAKLKPAQRAIAVHVCVSLGVLYAALPAVSVVVLSVLECRHYGEDLGLAAEPSTSCRTARYAVFRVYACVAVFVWPLGVPLTFVVLLFKHRSVMNPRTWPELNTRLSRQPNTGIKLLAFLCAGYNPWHYMHIVVDNAYRLSLVALLVFCDRKVGLAMSVTVSAAAVALLCGQDVYVHSGDRCIACAGAWQFLLYLLVALAQKTNLLSASASTATRWAALLVVCSALPGGFAYVNACESRRAAQEAESELEHQASLNFGETTKAAHGFGVPVVITDQAMVITDANHAASVVFGWTKEEMLGHHILFLSQVLPPDVILATDSDAPQQKVADHMPQHISRAYSKRCANSNHASTDTLGSGGAGLSNEPRYSRLTIDSGVSQRSTLSWESRVSFDSDRSRKPSIANGGQVVGRKKNGAEIHLLADCRISVDHRGRKHRTFIFQDITALHHATDELEIQDRVLNQFIHEIRNKNAAAQFLLDHLLQIARNLDPKDLKAEMTRREADIEASIALLHEGDRLIRTRVDMYRVLKGNYDTEANVQSVDISTFMNKELAMASLLAGQNGVQFKAELPANLKHNTVQVRVDLYILEHVASNLINNARSHTTSGEVVFKFLGQKCHLLEFEVADTGTGISRELRMRLFHDDVTTGHDRGVGLGLVSCRLFAQSIGGNCYLIDTKVAGGGTGHGYTRFGFALPGRIVDDSSINRDATLGGRWQRLMSELNTVMQLPATMHVYIIDDSKMLRRMLLHRLGKVAELANASWYFHEYGTVESFLPELGGLAHYRCCPSLQDIMCTIDENLDARGGQLRGRDLIRKLRDVGYCGIVASASGDERSTAIHMALGAHFRLGKPAPSPNIIARMIVKARKDILRGLGDTTRD